MEHDFTKPLAAGMPPSSAHGRVHSEFCKVMFHKLSESNKNYIQSVLSVMAFIL